MLVTSRYDFVVRDNNKLGHNDRLVSYQWLHGMAMSCPLPVWCALDRDLWHNLCTSGQKPELTGIQRNHSFCLPLHACSYNSSLCCGSCQVAPLARLLILFTVSGIVSLPYTKLVRRTRNFTLKMQNKFMGKFVPIGWIRNDCADDSWNGLSFVFCWSC